MLEELTSAGRRLYYKKEKITPLLRTFFLTSEPRMRLVPLQHLAADGARSAFAMEVYEAHARVALEAADLGELGACLAALVPLHAATANASAHIAEFVACASA